MIQRHQGIRSAPLVQPSSTRINQRGKRRSSICHCAGGTSPKTVAHSLRFGLKPLSLHGLLRAAWLWGSVRGEIKPVRNGRITANMSSGRSACSFGWCTGDPWAPEHHMCWGGKSGSGGRFGRTSSAAPRASTHLTVLRWSGSPPK